MLKKILSLFILSFVYSYSAYAGFFFVCDGFKAVGDAKWVTSASIGYSTGPYAYVGDPVDDDTLEHVPLDRVNQAMFSLPDFQISDWTHHFSQTATANQWNVGWKLFFDQRTKKAHLYILRHASRWADANTPDIVDFGSTTCRSE